MAKKKFDDKNNQNGEVTKHDDGSSNDEEPNFSDPEGFVDDIPDEGMVGACFTLYFLIEIVSFAF